MHCLFVLFVTAVCFLFPLKLKWPRNKNILFGINFEYILILADQNNLIKKVKHML